MIKVLLILVFLTFSPCECLFAVTPSHNFTLPSLTVYPKYIVLDGTGSKFIAWNERDEMSISGTNGLELCFGRMSLPIKSIIWPDYYAPIVLYDEGRKVGTLSEYTCGFIKTYDVEMVTGVSGERGSNLTFNRYYGRMRVVITGILAAYQIDIETPSKPVVYATMDTSVPRITQVAEQKPIDSSTIYLSIVDKDNHSSVKVFAFPPFQRQISFNDTVIERMQPSMNFPYVLTQGTPFSDQNSTVIQSFEPYAGKPPVTKLKRAKTGEVRLISDGNLFDAAVFSNQRQFSFEVFNLDTAASIQNLTNRNIYEDFCFDYQNRVLVIADAYRKVIVYSYENDRV